MNGCLKENMHKDSKFNLDIFIRFFLRDLQPYFPIRNTVFWATDMSYIWNAVYRNRFFWWNPSAEQQSKYCKILTWYDLILRGRASLQHPYLPTQRYTIIWDGVMVGCYNSHSSTLQLHTMHTWAIKVGTTYSKDVHLNFYMGECLG